MSDSNNIKFGVLHAQRISVDVWLLPSDQHRRQFMSEAELILFRDMRVLTTDVIDKLLAGKQPDKTSDEQYRYSCLLKAGDHAMKLYLHRLRDPWERDENGQRIEDETTGEYKRRTPPLVYPIDANGHEAWNGRPMAGLALVTVDNLREYAEYERTRRRMGAGTVQASHRRVSTLAEPLQHAIEPLLLHEPGSSDCFDFGEPDPPPSESERKPEE